MGDLIDRKVLLESLKASRLYHEMTSREMELLIRCENIVMGQPTAAISEWRVTMKDGTHGKWEKTYNGMRMDVNTGSMMSVYKCKCSICGWKTGNQGTRFNFCPKCGAKMDGKE